MSTHPLEEILHPRSIAVVGASGSGRGGGFIAPLQELGYKGEIYPVNPKYSEIMGIKAYPSVRDIPGPVDYVISSIPASQVLGMIEDCSQKGVKAIHLFTARFSETGRKDAAELEQEILRQARKEGIRLIGPNCMGVYYPREGIAFNSGMPREPGSVGLISQSGMVVGQVVNLAGQRSIRFSKAISYGNALDFNECDYLEYFAQDPETEVILMYVEGVRDGKRFFRSLRKATSTKPVIILKGGRGKSGTRATASHTASLAGSIEIWETVVNQAGAVSAQNLEELVDIACAFYFLPPVTGRRVGVAGGSGGSSVLAADRCEEAGLDVIPLPNEIREELKRKDVPVWDWISNPIDMSISGDTFDAWEVAAMMARNPKFDFLVIFMSTPFHRRGRGQGRPRISVDKHLEQYRLEEMNHKPLLVVMEDSWGDGVGNRARKVLAEMTEKVIVANIPVYPNIERAARAVSKMIDYYQRRK